MPSVSVVVPSYNRVELLRRALDSVLAQTRLPEEIWLVDDGSTDSTAELMAESYPHINYCFQENRGVSAARNLGIKKSSSEWVAFLDSDDEWLEDKLDTQLAALKKEPDYRLVHCDEIWIRRGRRVNAMNKHAKSGGDIFDSCLPLCAISPSAVLIEKQLLTELGGFDESLPACEDYDLWLKICSRYSVLYVDKQLLKKYGGHDDQLSAKHWGMDRFRVQALSNLLAANTLTNDQQSAARKMLLYKCNILLSGARKRHNIETEEQIQRLLREHNLLTEQL